MNNIQTDKRNSLNFETLGSLMKVHSLCPAETKLKSDNDGIQRILTIWKHLPIRLKYGSEKKIHPKITTHLLFSHIVKSSSSVPVFKMPDDLKTKILASKRTLRLTVKDEKVVCGVTLDDDWMEDISSTDATCAASDFIQSIKDHREPVSDSTAHGKKAKVTANLRTGDGN
jgi:hypothetical protein